MPHCSAVWKSTVKICGHHTCFFLKSLMNYVQQNVLLCHLTVWSTVWHGKSNSSSKMIELCVGSWFWTDHHVQTWWPDIFRILSVQFTILRLLEYGLRYSCIMVNKDKFFSGVQKVIVNGITAHLCPLQQSSGMSHKLKMQRDFVNTHLRHRRQRSSYCP